LQNSGNIGIFLISRLLVPIHWKGSAGMKTAKAFKDHFDEHQERHILLREQLNACTFTGEELENRLSAELEKYESWRYSLMDQLGRIASDFNQKDKRNS